MNFYVLIPLWFSRVHNFRDDNLSLVLTSRKISNAVKLKKKSFHASFEFRKFSNDRKIKTFELKDS